MLSDQERAEIEADLEHYPNKRAACIEALKVVQRHRRWVSDEALADIAGFLELSVAELDGVATFYNQIYRKPVGKHVVLMCDSVSCYVLGLDRVQARLEHALGCTLGETSPDGSFTLIPTPCLGCCDHAPALMIDDDLHVDLDPDRVSELLDRYRRQA